MYEAEVKKLQELLMTAKISCFLAGQEYLQKVISLIFEVLTDCISSSINIRQSRL